MEKIKEYRNILVASAIIGTGALLNAGERGILDNRAESELSSGDIIGKIVCEEGTIGKAESEGYHSGMSGFQVYIAGTSHVAITDEEGNFRLSYVPRGTQDITIGIAEYFGVMNIGTIPEVNVRTRRVTDVGEQAISCGC